MLKLHVLSAAFLLYSFTVAAPPQQLPASQNLTIQQFNSAIENSTLALNLTVPRPSAPSHPLPSDPMHYRVSDSKIWLTFRNYTVPLDQHSAEECYLAVQGDLLVHGDRIGKLMGKRELDYQWGSVVLLIKPGEKMRWTDLGYVARGIGNWLNTYGAVDLNYDVLLQGTGQIGAGQLTTTF